MQNENRSLNLAENFIQISGLRILYVAMKYDYGKAEQGYSFEHYNFYESLRHMGHTILYFDFMSLMQQHGREWMNHRLIEVVKTEKPDLMFTFLFSDEFDQGTLRYISESTDTVTFNWFADDHWRFDNYSRHWAFCFNWVATTAQSALSKYKEIGYQNVIKSQWGCNHLLYRKLDLPFKYDVTFIGQPHGDRRQMIDQLQQAGLKVQVWGNGWEAGRLSQEEMIQVFNASRINLNLTNSIAMGSPTSANSRSRSLPRRLLSRLKRSLISTPILEQPKLQVQQYTQQIKGRNFEIPGCGGFLLTGQADNLEDYYLPDKEIVYFNTTSDLIEKIQYYLKHENERAAIAQAGYKRTFQEHTYVQRFTNIFQQMGLSYSPSTKDKISMGETIEIA
jgi:spore maturation protein CgeB